MYFDNISRKKNLPAKSFEKAIKARVAVARDHLSETEKSLDYILPSLLLPSSLRKIYIFYPSGMNVEN